MGFLNMLFSGIGSILGVIAETVSTVVSAVREGLESYVSTRGTTTSRVASEAERRRDRLREVNDEIMHLRNIRMGSGSMSDQDRKRWNVLREERDELMAGLNQAKEVKAAEKILQSEGVIEKVEVDLHTTHVLQYNAFADILGKKCPKCARQMKLQWQRDLSVVGPREFFWGCTGWYVQTPKGHACNHREPLQRSDYGLMTDLSAPEFSMTADEFGEILTNPSTTNIISTRLQDLRSDLQARKAGIELATCPVHGENMVLRQKSNPSGLLDAYFLACPHWLPNNQGCAFIEKLKSGSQLAALLKSETGRGIL